MLMAHGDRLVELRPGGLGRCLGEVAQLCVSYFSDNFCANLVYPSFYVVFQRLSEQRQPVQAGAASGRQVEKSQTAD